MASDSCKAKNLAYSERDWKLAIIASFRFLAASPSANRPKRRGLIRNPDEYPRAGASGLLCRNFKTRQPAATMAAEVSSPPAEEAFGRVVRKKDRNGYS